MPSGAGRAAQIHVSACPGHRHHGGAVHVRLVADFVRRLRRVALHPLARDDQGELLRELMAVRVHAIVFRVF
jgi:hypothetical protein